MRPPEDDEPQSWWVASTAIPLVAATTGPLTNVMSVVALVMPWRSKILPNAETAAGTSIQEGYPDPHWATVLNAVSLFCGIVGNAFLLFNFTQIVRYIIALPVTIFLWFTAAGILCGITIAMDVYAPPVGIDRVYSQAYWSAVIAAVLYFILSVTLMVNMLGYFLGKYPQHFALTKEQRTLILQMTALVVWLLIGAAIFRHFLGISFADALYFADVTVLTLGYGNIVATNDVSRGLIWPYAVIGIIILGLVVESIFKFAREVHYDNVIRKHIEQKRQSTFERSVDFQELESTQEQHPTGGEVITPPGLTRQKSEPRRHLHHRPIRNTINALATARRPKIIIMREEKDRFHAMRRIQHDTMRFRRWNNLIISIVAFGIVWSCGAVVFWKLEAMDYFEALYFCFTSLLTIGYGDFTPESNPGKPFFVVWSLIAIPTMTMLISEMTDTVVASFKRATEVFADYFVLPQSRVYKTWFGRIPGVVQFVLSRQEKKRQERGFPLEGADESDSGERADSDEPGQSNNGSDDFAESHPHQSLEELAREPTTLELTQQLAFAIRRTSKQAREGKRKRYSYEEWVEFTRLIQFTDPRARPPSKRNQPASEDGLSNDEDEYGILNWDWIGESSPMLAKQTEPEWILDRLCESLIRYVSTPESRAVGDGADLTEEPTLRKERDIGLDE
ncbi:Ion transport 2 [Penicillium italicum]|uniref:Ion transport 2 n=1 Tax=Penicillium italicum TaxID=40296 RepID=A0A0A2LEK4_PENIT|nr:Ion transport 2 [Penicillium italicum]